MSSFESAERQELSDPKNSSTRLEADNSFSVTVTTKKYSGKHAALKELQSLRRKESRKPKSHEKKNRASCSSACTAEATTAELSLTEESPFIMTRASEPSKLLGALQEIKLAENLTAIEIALRNRLKNALLLRAAARRSAIIKQLHSSREDVLFEKPQNTNTIVWLQEERWCNASLAFIQMLRAYACNLLSQRYLADRIRLPSSKEFLTYVLPNSPDHIYEHHVRMTRVSFQRVKEILLSEAGHIFASTSEKQTPLEHQMYIAFYLFGFYGNGAGIEEARVKFGTSLGNIVNCRRRVVRALIHLMPKYIRWPDADERELLCKEVKNEYGFHHAFFLVDGTTHPFAFKPEYQSATWFDRKSRYSVQSLVTCDMHTRIINLVVGWPGSTHDARVMRSAEYMNDEFAEKYFTGDQHGLGDAAFGIHKRVVPNYKAPWTKYVENVIYNREHSRLRVRSEHAIGRIKGRFQALKELRFMVKRKENLVKVVNFISAAYVLHNILLHVDDQYCPPSVDSIANVTTSVTHDETTTETMHETSAFQFRERVKKQVLRHIGYT